jgi:hypothetical protein
MQSKRWEYKDFVYKLPSGRIRANCGQHDYYNIIDLIPVDKFPIETKKGIYTFEQAKALFWREFKDEINPELKKWLDQGWEPADAIGPNCIAIRTFKSFTKDPVRKFIFILLSIIMIGLPFIWRNTFAEPTEFRLMMRRPARW